MRTDKDCATNYTFSENWCLAPAEYSAKMCNTTAYLISDSVLGYQCKACPGSCASCFFDSGRVQCQQCNTNFTHRLVQNKFGICEPNLTALVPLTCNADQFYCFIMKSCQSCPLGCASCSESFVTGEMSIKCSKCTDDFTWYTDYKCYKKCPEAQVSYFTASGQ